MDRPPDFSEYGEKSLDHLIAVKDEEVKKLLAQQTAANTTLFYALMERNIRKTEHTKQ